MRFKDDDDNFMRFLVSAVKEFIAPMIRDDAGQSPTLRYLHLVQSMRYHGGTRSSWTQATREHLASKSENTMHASHGRTMSMCCIPIPRANDSWLEYLQPAKPTYLCQFGHNQQRSLPPDTSSTSIKPKPSTHLHSKPLHPAPNRGVSLSSPPHPPIRFYYLILKTPKAI